MSQIKPILFYSSHCIYSTETIDLLQKYNCSNEFNLVNISNKKYKNKIPGFVKAVPCIYVNKQILNDDDVENFIRLNFGTKIENIDPFQSEMNGSIGSSFAFIGSDDNNDVSGTKNNFMFINEDYSIQTPEADPFNPEGQKNNNSGNNNTNIPQYSISGNNNGNNTGNSSMEEMNRYQQARDADLEKLFNNNKNAQNRQFVR